MKLRKWNRIIHRDLGYLLFGLTVVYAISGFMLNHKSDWNPNYTINRTDVEFKPLTGLSKDIEIPREKVIELLKNINIQDNFTDYFRTAPEKLQVSFPNKVVYLYLDKGMGLIEVINERKVLKTMNNLHLNLPRKVWTFLADFYAFGLLLLAITGLFILKGKHSITKRGAWITAIGVIIPIIFLIIYW